MHYIIIIIISSDKIQNNNNNNNSFKMQQAFATNIFNLEAIMLQARASAEQPQSLHKFKSTYILLKFDM